jgi:hypothetical protein
MKMSDRDRAARAAEEIRIWLDQPDLYESRCTHILLANPRRGMWVEMWTGIPGFMRDNLTGEYQHSLLPGWTYNRAEVQTEMLEDLERFAATGERPKVATRGK